MRINPLHPYTVCFDLDGCTVNLYTALCNTYFRWSGRFFNTTDVKSWRLEDVFGITEDEVWRLINHVLINQLARPVIGAVASLQALHDKVSLVGLTARDSTYRACTEQWLNHYKVPYDDLIFDEEKYKYAPAINVMIEDNAEQALQIANAGAQVLLIDYPYNRCITHEKVHRVYNWEEIVAWIEKDLGKV